MKKQLVTFASAVALIFVAGALLADTGAPVAGPDSLQKINSVDGVEFSQSSFDRMIHNKKRRDRRRHRRHNRRSRMRAITSYLVKNSNVRRRRRVSGYVRPGQRVYFYYKAGPIDIRRGRAYVKRRLIVRRNGRVVKRTRWMQTDARRARGRSRYSRMRGRTIRYYQAADLSYYVRRSRRSGGRYTATVYLRDVRGHRTVSFRYTWRVRNRGRYNRGRRHYRGGTRYYRRGTRRYNRGTRYYRRGTPRGATRYYKR